LLCRPGVFGAKTRPTRLLWKRNLISKEPRSIKREASRLPFDATLFRSAVKINSATLQSGAQDGVPARLGAARHRQSSRSEEAERRKPGNFGQRLSFSAANIFQIATTTSSAFAFCPSRAGRRHRPNNAEVLLRVPHKFGFFFQQRPTIGHAEPISAAEAKIGAWM